MQIICKDLTLGYHSKKVLENLSFTVNEKDYLLIVGENGTGKSTLIKTLLGLIPPLSGSVEFAGGLLKNEIGYLPQQSNFDMDFPAIVKEIVISGCLGKSQLRPFYTKEEKNLADYNMEKLNISNLKKSSFKNLSGGQRQRVLLARALCATSKVLLLDEPVSGLDPKTTIELYKTIKELNKETAIIMVSHDRNFPIEDTTHVLNLSANKFFGTREEFVLGGGING